MGPQVTDKPPFSDLTTMGSNVDPQVLFNDPRYVHQPDMPDGEPDLHELIRMVQKLEHRVRKLEHRVQKLEALDAMGNCWIGDRA